MLAGLAGIAGFTSTATGASSPAAPAGALVYHNSADANNPVVWHVEAYDDSTWWSSGNANRLIVPSGPTLVRVVGQTTTSGSSTPEANLLKGGAATAGLPFQLGQENWVGAVSAPMAVSATNYFTLTQAGGGTKDLAGGMWFGIETLDAATKYALVSKTGTQALSAATPTAVTWDNEVADTNGWHDNSTNPSYLTVPSGVTRVRVCFGLYSTANVNTPYFAYIAKNGSAVAGGAVVGETFTGRMNAGSAIMEVTPGDYFEVIAQTTSGQTISNNTYAWFSIEEVPNYARALVTKVATQSVTSGTPVALAFGTSSEVYDTAGIHDESTDNSRFTVPSGYTRARLCFSVVTASATGTSRAWVRKGGSGTIPLIGLPGKDSNITGADYLTGFGSWIDVTAGNYFELMFTPGANQTLPIDVRTYFGIELA